MEFFNKKEEVIDLKLTQYGRYLLSKGKLNPTYYSFFDDNILYDASKANIFETQNESEARIQETPTMHHQVCYSSLEKEFNNNYNKVLSGEKTAFSQDLQRTAEKHYSLPQPIGSSDINSEYSPSWTVQFLNGTVSGTVNYLNLSEKSGGKNTQIVPQIPSGVEVNLINVSGETDEIEEFEDGFADSNFVIDSDEDDLFVLLKVTENNGFFQKKNFDIEIFEIEEEKQNGTTIETLRPLGFSLKQDPTSEVSFVNEVTPETDVSHAEYYFDIFVDNEIDEEILCTYDPVNENMGVYSDPRTKLCQDIINKQKKKVFDIYSDEADYPGEIC